MISNLVTQKFLSRKYLRAPWAIEEKETWKKSYHFVGVWQVAV